MIEQDTVACIHAVGFAIVDGDPVCVQLSHSVGRARIEWGGLGLGSFDDLSVELRSGGLVESDIFLKPNGTDGVEKAKGSESVNIT